jgi:hypothetical protein
VLERYGPSPPLNLVASRCGSKRARPQAGGAIAGELASKVAKPAAERAINFLMGLLTGDAKGAIKSVKDDIIAV